MEVTEFFSFGDCSVPYPGFPMQNPPESGKSVSHRGLEGVEGATFDFCAITCQRIMIEEKFQNKILMKKGLQVSKNRGNADSLIVDTAIQHYDKSVEVGRKVIIIGKDVDLGVLMTALTPMANNIYLL